MRLTKKHSSAPHFHAFCVCVDYTDYLIWAMPHNRRHFDSFTVVTTAEDHETRRLCEQHGAAVVLAERLHQLDSAFDLGAAINDGLAVLEREYPDDWICIVDADVILPWDLRQRLSMMELDRSCIYGIERGEASDNPISGFFQLFHGSLRRRYQEGHKSAGHTDMWFRDLWPPDKQITIPGLKAQHLSRNAVNWAGRITPRLEPPTHMITPDTPVADTKRLLCQGGKLGLPFDWRRWPNVQQAYREAMATAVTTMPYPEGKYFGRGIVILGGGKYFGSTYVTLRMLRHVGCNLPVEVWYLGRKGEMLDWQATLLEKLGAKCVDADAVAANRPVRILNGWELKAFAVLHSRFEQVLYLDADSYPCRNPQFLFDEPSFRQHGAMFFPDAPWMKLLPEVWEIMGIPFRDERTIESGQFLIDKRRAWQPLALTHWMNQRSDYYYHVGPRKSEQVGEHYGRGVHGDKDTFHLAWRYLNHDYVMPETDYAWIPPAVVQHAPDGQPVFVHRARRKFSLDGAYFWTSKQEGPEYEPKLPMEDIAHRFLAELCRLVPAEYLSTSESGSAQIVPPTK
jgi:hypothetical protein